MASPSKLSKTPSMPLFPLSPERMNIQKQPVSQTPPPQGFDSQTKVASGLFDPFVNGYSSNPSSPTRNPNSDVQGMVARFNALEIKDHAELRRRDEAALKRAQMAREQAEEVASAAREDARALKRDLDEGRDRERKVMRRLDAVMEQLHSEKEKMASMQKTYEREIRRARKEAFKSSSLLLETQKELKVTKAGFSAAKQNLEKWVVPDGEELKARADGLELQLCQARRLIQYMKLECAFGICTCKIGCGSGLDEEVVGLMDRLKPNTSTALTDEQPPPYEEAPIDQPSILEHPAQAHEDDVPQVEANAYHAKNTQRPSRRSSTVQPPGDTIAFSPRSGTFHQVFSPLSYEERPEEHSRPDEHDVEMHSPDADRLSHAHVAVSADDDDEDKRSAAMGTPPGATTTESEEGLSHETSKIARSANDKLVSAEEPIDDSTHVQENNLAITPQTNAFSEEDGSTIRSGQTMGSPEDEENDEEPPESPTTHIRATTQITTIPLTGLSSPAKPSLSADDLEPPESEQSADDGQDSFYHFTRTQCIPDSETATRRSRAQTPVEERLPWAKSAPVTPRLNTNVGSMDTMTPKTAGPDTNILSSTPWEGHASTPLTRDEAIAMLRARRGRARSQVQECQSATTGAGATPKRSTSHGQALSAKKGGVGAVTDARRDISTRSAPDLGNRMGKSPRKAR